MRALRSHRVSRVLVIAAASAVSAWAPAADYYWTGGADGTSINWNDLANWQLNPDIPGHVPGPNDVWIVNNPSVSSPFMASLDIPFAQSIVVSDLATAAAVSMTVGDYSTVTVQSGGTLAILGGLTDVGGAINLQGGTLQTNSASVDYDYASASVTLSGAGTLWQNAGVLNLGLNRGGDIRISNGAQLQTGTLNSTGLIVIDGAGSSLSTPGDAQLGSTMLVIDHGGSAAFGGAVQSSGAYIQLLDGTLKIGDLGGASLYWAKGTLDMSGSMTQATNLDLDAQKTLKVAQTLTISGTQVTLDGGGLSADTLEMANSNFIQSSGSLSINKLVMQSAYASTQLAELQSAQVSNGTWTNTGAYSVKPGQSLTIGAGGNVNHDVGSGNTLVVDGAVALTDQGASWNVNGSVAAGVNADVTIDTATGTSLTASENMSFGVSPGRTVTINSNGWLAAGGDLTFGDQGTAHVTSTGGGINGQNIVIGAQPGSAGYVALSGCSMNASGNLTVGAGGHGELSLDGSWLGVNSTLEIGSHGVVTLGTAGWSESTPYQSGLSAGNLLIQPGGQFIWNEGLLGVAGDATLGGNGLPSHLKLTPSRNLQVLGTLSIPAGCSLVMDSSLATNLTPGQLTVGSLALHGGGSFQWQAGGLTFRQDVTVDGSDVFGGHIVIDSTKLLAAPSLHLSNGSTLVMTDSELDATFGLTVDGVGSSVNQSGGVLSAPLRVSGGGTVTSTSDLRTSSIQVSGAGSRFDYAGNQLSLNGSVAVSDGGVVSLQQTADLYLQSLSVSGPGSVFQTPAKVRAGNLQVSTGGTVHVASLLSGIGTIVVNGAGAQLTSDQALSLDMVNVSIGDGGTLTSGAVDVGALGGLVVPPFIVAWGGAAIGVQGAGAHWSVGGDLRLAIAGYTQGNLTIADGGRVDVANLTTALWYTATSTIAISDPGSILNVAGNVNLAQAGTASLTLTNQGAMFATGGMSVGQHGTFTINGGDATIAGALTIANGGIVHLQDGKLAIGSLANSGTFDWQGGEFQLSTGNIRIGAGGFFSSDLVLDGTRKLNILGNVRVDPGYGLTFTNSAFHAGSVLLSGGTMSGAGDVGAVTGTIDSSITAIGDLAMGDSTKANGFVQQGTLDVGNHTVTLRSNGYAALGSLTTVDGGSIVAPRGVALATGGNLVGRGVIDAPLSASTGSFIDLTGDLAVGKSTATDGFYSYGRTDVHEHTLTIYDRNSAVLGSITTLGNDATGQGGRIAAPNGLLLDDGKSLEGFGHIVGALRNNGDAYGGDTPDRALVFDGLVNGRGSYHGYTTFNGGFSPGLSPAIVYLDTATFSASNVLTIELGGTTPGLQYDQVIANYLHLGGELDVKLINGFVPQIGDHFDFIQAGTLVGQFDTVKLPAGLGWQTQTDGGNMMLTVVAVPEPGIVMAASVVTLSVLSRRRRRA